MAITEYNESRRIDTEKPLMNSTVTALDESHSSSLNTPDRQHGQGSFSTERPVWMRTILMVIDLLLAASPLLFIGIALAAIAYNKKPIGYASHTIRGVDMSFNGGDIIIDAARIAVSIFPIIFAAIAGRFLKAYALHRAEHGSQMGVLEQLYGSQSLANALQLSVALKGPGLIGVGVVLLWLLSPLGGQGVGRVLGRTTWSTYSASTAFYTDTSANLTAFISRRSSSLTLPPTSALLTSALLTDRLADSENDVWGNVKIPYFHSIKSSNNSEWLTPDANSTSSSLVGITVYNLTADAGTEFNMSSSYVTLNCQEPLSFSYMPPDYSTDSDGVTALANMTGYNRFMEWYGTTSTSMLTNSTDTNTTDTSSQKWSDWQYLLDVRSSLNNDFLNTILRPPTIIYASQSFSSPDWSGSVIKAYECRAEVEWIQVSVECPSNQNCYLTQARSIQRPQELETDSIFSEYPSANTDSASPIVNLLSFLNSFGSYKNTGVTVWGPASTIVAYLAGAGVYETTDQPVNDTAIPQQDLDYRLATLINTAWLISLQQTNLAMSSSTNTTLSAVPESDPLNYMLPSGKTLNYVMAPSPATTIFTTEIYQTNWAWVSVDIVISCVLLALGIAGFYFRQVNRHPDVLGFVSTLTRDNPNFDAPPQAEKFDGLEMASYYKHTRVQLVRAGDGSEDDARITLRPQ